MIAWLWERWWQIRAWFVRRKPRIEFCPWCGRPAGRSYMAGIDEPLPNHGMVVECEPCEAHTQIIGVDAG